eukprot:scaffold15422_cov107-Isochrysis_galbana.AAC.10
MGRRPRRDEPLLQPCARGWDGRNGVGVEREPHHGGVILLGVPQARGREKFILVERGRRRLRVWGPRTAAQFCSWGGARSGCGRGAVLFWSGGAVLFLGRRALWLWAGRSFVLERRRGFFGGAAHLLNHFAFENLVVLDLPLLVRLHDGGDVPRALRTDTGRG